MIDPLEKAVDLAAIKKVIETKDAEIANLRAKLANTEDWIRILEKTHRINNQLSEERHSAVARQNAETIARLQESVEDTIHTLESMNMHIDNPLYSRLRSTLEAHLSQDASATG